MSDRLEQVIFDVLIAKGMSNCTNDADAIAQALIAKGLVLDEKAQGNFRDSVITRLGSILDVMSLKTKSVQAQFAWNSIDAYLEELRAERKAATIPDAPKCGKPLYHKDKVDPMLLVGHCQKLAGHEPAKDCK